MSGDRHVRGELAQWDQHEGSLVHPGVWYTQTRLIDDPIPVHEQIQIERPGTPSDFMFTITPVFMFNPEQPLKQFTRLESALHTDDTIEIAALPLGTDRIGLDDARLSDQRDIAQLAYCINRRIDGPHSVAKI